VAARGKQKDEEKQPIQRGRIRARETSNHAEPLQNIKSSKYLRKKAENEQVRKKKTERRAHSCE